jgi:Transposase and inactivated derivatives
MRHTRIKLPAPASYHITSRIKDDEFLLEDDADKRDLLGIIRRAAEFAGIAVMSYAILDNHFHLLVNIPARQEVGDDELVRRARILWGDEKAEEQFGRWRFWESRGDARRAENARNALRRRMYDISPFVKTVKDAFCHSYKHRHGTGGAVWGRTRFKSAAVASDFATLATVAAYIDLNAVRAKIVRHPKSYKWCSLGAAKKGDRFALEGMGALAHGCGKAEAPRSYNGAGANWNANASNAAASAKADAGANANANAGAGANVSAKASAVTNASANANASAAASASTMSNAAALDAYLRFLDGTKNMGDRFASGKTGGSDSRGASGSDSREGAASTRGGYVRKTLDSADLTRLGADGVSRWLAESEIKPESWAEMWTRRFANFVDGGIIAPLEALLTARERIMRGDGMPRRWQPHEVGGVWTLVSARNTAARKRNAG